MADGDVPLRTLNNQTLVVAVDAQGEIFTLRVQDAKGHNRAVAKLDRLTAASLATGLIHWLDTIPRKDYTP
jgi:hypothetical protein